ncbi:MAG: 3-keto-5-aminohexanoate cleavage protein [Acidimicrobiales bacterium]
MATPVVIEVAVNGVTTKERNPLVPSTSEEIAADAIRCIDAGASIVHIHNPAMRLGTAEAAAMYAQALRIMRRERPTAVLYPTMGGGANISERYDHHLPLADEGLIDMGVIDPGSVNLSSSGADGAPPTGDYVYVNSPADIGYMMDVCRSKDIGPSFAIYEPGFLRMVLIYQQSGLLAPHSLTKFYFSGGAYFGRGTPTFSAPPIVEALDLYLAMLADTPLPWGVAVLGGSILDTPIAERALERGGHLRVGLEDDASGPANVDQVKRAVELCEKLGRPVATCAQARELLAL